jgi:hypothetical protein
MEGHGITSQKENPKSGLSLPGHATYMDMDIYRFIQYAIPIALLHYIRFIN